MQEGVAWVVRRCCCGGPAHLELSGSHHQKGTTNIQTAKDVNMFVQALAGQAGVIMVGLGCGNGI